MAQSEDIHERIRRINPGAFEIPDSYREILLEMGDEGDGITIITEDMTGEEKEMAAIAAYIRQGMPLEDARQLAA